MKRIRIIVHLNLTLRKLKRLIRKLSEIIKAADKQKKRITPRTNQEGKAEQIWVIVLRI
jgi:hypothetical protein